MPVFQLHNHLRFYEIFFKLFFPVPKLLTSDSLVGRVLESLSLSSMSANLSFYFYLFVFV